MAESTGIVRKLDELGRIVIPKELRDIMDIKYKDSFEIFTSEESIILKQYRRACIFCGNAEATFDYRGKKVCNDCMANIAQEVNVVLLNMGNFTIGNKNNMGGKELC